MGKSFYAVHCEHVEDFLSGKRRNPTLCTTRQIAKRLEKKYKVVFMDLDIVNEEAGLHMFKIRKI